MTVSPKVNEQSSKSFSSFASGTSGRFVRAFIGLADLLNEAIALSIAVVLRWGKNVEN